MHQYFKIIYEDQHLIVIDKASGLLSQGAYENEINLVDLLRTYFGRHYVGLIHRLDRKTSGLMVVGKRTKSAQRLTLSLQNNQLQRQYLAWLEGDFFQVQGITVSDQKSDQKYHWFDLIQRDENDFMSICQPQTTQKTTGFKEAHLDVSCLKQSKYHGKTISLCAFQLQTGRTHQIRAQSSSRKLPLLGDPKYGSRLGFGRLALHSYLITFPHPMTDEILTFQTELPTELQL